MHDKIRQQLRFIGQVQGVGFRYTALKGANMLGLTGWVYNDYDGSVLMQVQGPLETINQLIQILSQGTFINIERIERENIELDELERSFRVR
ncbi:MAG: acylphosphatase [Treponemataceae bacterium]|nr:acylphosphatase [Treponemataceae bacterium]